MRRLTVVQSDMIHAVGYDRATRTLEVIFNDGRIYLYRDVPRAVYAGLLAASSKGKYMHANVIDTYISAPWKPGQGPGAAVKPVGRKKRAR